MLVLKRYKGERVVIIAGDQKIIVEVRSPGATQLGFTADPSVTIVREELKKRDDE